ncbi:exodeoxyribonuclease VII small subunit [Butyrivibrio sp. YAB3001]|uniref:exodeoxyribonuclease VII small subunit n=1 Tax=Butyrivibrio sp. YAB3001 TaxID=1520812 RepID=UPI0008F63908|nr:exodeoxyribonuclease VII small subunit [Butyrivibrio sp. YAB3001]SFC92447.1 Exodeoxyribonuclease VII small subunit [Butyrivibrio sp. YAB3001]
MAARKKQQQDEEKISIEEAFALIEAKIEALEDEGITLEDSFKEYQEGMKLLKYCHDEIDKVEQKVQMIAENGTLEDFE